MFYNIYRQPCYLFYKVLHDIQFKHNQLLTIFDAFMNLEDFPCQVKLTWRTAVIVRESWQKKRPRCKPLEAICSVAMSRGIYLFIYFEIS